MKDRIGCHLSIAGGVAKAVGRAAEADCSAFQIFTRNPRGWAHAELTDEEIAEFRKGTQKDGPFPVAHMPYLPNLAAPNVEIYRKSVDTLASELVRCGKLGIAYLVTHLGSHLGLGEKEGRERIVQAIRTALDQSGSSTMVLMENTAGTKNSLGTTPEELAIILDAMDGDKRVGLCIDTAHAFAAGYDWRSKDNPFYSELKSARLHDRVMVIHLNDSKVALGKRADRHEHLGLGEIGLEGLKNAVTHPLFRNLPCICETPVDETRDDKENVAIARKLRSN